MEILISFLIGWRPKIIDTLEFGIERNPDELFGYNFLFAKDSEDEQEASKGIVQVIYENVYYSPLILPEIEDSSGSPSCDSPVTTTWI